MSRHATKVSVFRRIVADAVAVFILSVIFGTTLASLGPTIETDKHFRWALLFLVWLSVLLLTYLNGHQWLPTVKQRVIIVACVGIALFGLAKYEDGHAPSEISSSAVAEKIAEKEQVGPSGPRIEVWLTRLIPPKGKHQAFFNLFLKNSGDATATGISILPDLIRADGKIPQAQEDLFFQKMVQRSPYVPKASDSDLLPGNDMFWHSIQVPLPRDEIKKIIKGNTEETLYWIVLYRYRDIKTKQVYVTEVCHLLAGGIVHNCYGHNFTKALNKL